MGQSDGPRGTQGAGSGLPSGRSTRCIALIGPFLSGKTTLLDAILARTGGVARAGRVADKSTVGDGSPEARAHGMSVQLNIADAEFLGDSFTFIDCPGSIEFQHEGALALTACDAAVVVSEPDPKRVPALQVILKQLEDRGIPHILFLNKIDACETPIRDIVPALQPASTKPLVLRQIPIWENGVATGFIDLALERAFLFRKDAPSEMVEIKPNDLSREKEARFHMLEQLADYDDTLMEQLLSDVAPDKELVFSDLVREFSDGLICPVLLGSAERGHGILRLLKALRHEVPFVESTAQRLGVDGAKSAAYVLKTLHTGHGGKLSIARVLSGDVPDGATVTGGEAVEERVAGVFGLKGEETLKKAAARAGDLVALGRLDGVKTGDTISAEKGGVAAIAAPDVPEPVLVSGIGLKDRKDEVKLSAALGKLVDEDPSLVVEHAGETHQVLLKGQGEMHLRVAFERLARKYGVVVERRKRQVPYKETIRKPIEIRGRHKKQSGGHGQFGDVLIDIAPLPRGSGFTFNDTITGGVVPKQFIPSVEIGVSDYMKTGPLGFPVVDVAVTLKDGSFHTVDSSDMAFRQAGRLAMSEGMPKCQPVLLEPVMAVDIAVPSEATARVNGMISQRRGQILGFDARPGWPGWDVVSAHIPDSEIEDLIVELRSATTGVGTYTASFHHLAELTGRLADQVLASHREAAE
ncbi:elongation factor G [Hyphomicrobium nitrativorans NL23]|uniref:Elongation factor G n=1 Tax=Hyphomicrobium nitrativorans NL23 TaxID=1029756 RepID=V5SDG5_9HYPH|nr:elongation factor G [Hyphomicrobium nitrativorans]AHB48532.1 elongation factor G [Hyphomicrobium nitrativorans NL23]